MIYIYTKQSVWNSQRTCERLFDNSFINIHLYIGLQFCCLLANSLEIE